MTTLAFALATVPYFLNPQFFDWVPTQRFDPEPLLGVWDFGATTEGMYQLCLIVFVLRVAAVSGIRPAAPGGRWLRCARTNGAPAPTASPWWGQAHRVRDLGLLRRVAGIVLVQLNHQFTLGLFPLEENLMAFTAAVVGGLGSVLGAVLGALFLKGGEWFLHRPWRLFAASASACSSCCSCSPAG